MDLEVAGSTPVFHPFQERPLMALAMGGFVFRPKDEARFRVNKETNQAQLSFKSIVLIKNWDRKIRFVILLDNMARYISIDINQ